MFKIILVILFIGFAWLAFTKLTDRICDKQYSPEFKATSQYKAMQCNNK